MYLIEALGVESTVLQNLSYNSFWFCAKLTEPKNIKQKYINALLNEHKCFVKEMNSY